MQILAVFINATNDKPRHRFINAIGMANAVMRELRGTPSRARHKAHVYRILAINKFNLFHRRIAILRIIKPFIRQIKRQRMVCNIAIAPPDELAN